MQEKKYLWIVGVVVLVLVAVFMQFRAKNLGGVVSMPTASTANATTTAAEGTLEELIQSGKVKVSVSTTTTNAKPSKPAPSLSYNLKISSSLSAEAVVAINTQMASLNDVLKKDPTSFESWMRMGVLAKIAGDYPRALEVWEYAGLLVPKAAEPFANMGELYGNYLRDYAKAEMYYKKAIANEPNNPLWAQALKDLQMNVK